LLGLWLGSGGVKDLIEVLNSNRLADFSEVSWLFEML